MGNRNTGRSTSSVNTTKSAAVYLNGDQTMLDENNQHDNESNNGGGGRAHGASGNENYHDDNESLVDPNDSPSLSDNANVPDNDPSGSIYAFLSATTHPQVDLFYPFVAAALEDIHPTPTAGQTPSPATSSNSFYATLRHLDPQRTRFRHLELLAAAAASAQSERRLNALAHYWTAHSPTAGLAVVSGDARLQHLARGVGWCRAWLRLLYEPVLVPVSTPVDYAADTRNLRLLASLTDCLTALQRAERDLGDAEVQNLLSRSSASTAAAAKSVASAGTVRSAASVGSRVSAKPTASPRSAPSSLASSSASPPDSAWIDEMLSALPRAYAFAAQAFDARGGGAPGLAAASVAWHAMHSERRLFAQLLATGRLIERVLARRHVEDMPLAQRVHVFRAADLARMPFAQAYALREAVAARFVAREVRRVQRAAQRTAVYRFVRRTSCPRPWRALFLVVGDSADYAAAAAAATAAAEVAAAMPRSSGGGGGIGDVNGAVAAAAATAAVTAAAEASAATAPGSSGGGGDVATAAAVGAAAAIAAVAAAALASAVANVAASSGGNGGANLSAAVAPAAAIASAAAATRATRGGDGSGNAAEAAASTIACAAAAATAAVEAVARALGQTGRSVAAAAINVVARAAANAASTAAAAATTDNPNYARPQQHPLATSATVVRRLDQRLTDLSASEDRAALQPLLLRPIAVRDVPHDLSCSICHRGFAAEQVVLQTWCKHKFHLLCVFSRWDLDERAAAASHRCFRCPAPRCGQHADAPGSVFGLRPPPRDFHTGPRSGIGGDVRRLRERYRDVLAWQRAHPRAPLSVEQKAVRMAYWRRRTHRRDRLRSILGGGGVSVRRDGGGAGGNGSGGNADSGAGFLPRPYDWHPLPLRQMYAEEGLPAPQHPPYVYDAAEERLVPADPAHQGAPIFKFWIAGRD